MEMAHEQVGVEESDPHVMLTDLEKINAMMGFGGRGSTSCFRAWESSKAFY